MKCTKEGCDGELRALSTSYKEGLVIRTRRCTKCNQNYKSVEMPMEDYNKAVKLMEAMAEIVREFI